MTTLDDFAAAMDRASVEIPKQAGLALRSTAFAITGTAQVLAAYKTGNLKNSIQTTVVGPLSAKISVGAHYGIFVEEGTAPHTISAAPGKVLAFPGRTGTVFTSRVSHPGTKAQPFMAPAIDKHLPALVSALVRTMGGVV